MLNAVSPIDGRYKNKTNELSTYFSEAALIKYRVKVEVEYFKALVRLGLPQLKGVEPESLEGLDSVVSKFDNVDAQKIKDIEKVTNHDVKAVEYFVKDAFDYNNLNGFKEFVHFALTSQDINNTAVPMSINDALNDVYYPLLSELIDKLKEMASSYYGIPMLARTHGQAASPTSVGKELLVFIERLDQQFDLLQALPIKAKFGGATGNFNAHVQSYPDIDWKGFADNFVKNLGLERSQYTTQIAHYDHLAAIFHNLMRINTILIDLSRDIWHYISIDYFTQITIANEVGSSAMPHKVNPIDFENAEGNLGMANSIYDFMASKLPVSRLQRDLTDSTVLRNVGVPMAHGLIAFKSLLKGLNKLKLNEQKLNQDLDNNWAVVAEAIQNILRREAFPKPYEALKSLTRGNKKINKEKIREFIENLNVSDSVKEELFSISPQSYIGYR